MLKQKDILILVCGIILGMIAYHMGKDMIGTGGFEGADKQERKRANPSPMVKDGTKNGY